MLKLPLLLYFGISIVLAGPREEAIRLLDQFQSETNNNSRLEQISRIFLGFPYGKGGPLGEGKEGRYDQDPLYRFDSFDCTTFVETMIALATSRSLQEFEYAQDQIRYSKGNIDYLTRKHFTDLQWIPENIAEGFFTEITDSIGGQTKMARAMIDFGGWLRSHKIEQIIVPMASQEERLDLLEELHSLAASYSPVEARVPYIEINYIITRPALLDRIPTPSVVNFVRPNWDLTQVAGTHQNISHQGLLFRRGKTLYLRHATITSGKVEELPLLDYLKRFVNHETLKGIHLLKINL
jgi:hypothetical protein